MSFPNNGNERVLTPTCVPIKFRFPDPESIGEFCSRWWLHPGYMIPLLRSSQSSIIDMHSRFLGKRRRSSGKFVECVDGCTRHWLEEKKYEKRSRARNGLHHTVDRVCPFGMLCNVWIGTVVCFPCHRLNCLEIWNMEAAQSGESAHVRTSFAYEISFFVFHHHYSG